jgi:hypothetical protein
VDVILPEVAPLETDLTYPEHPVKILDLVSHGAGLSSSSKCNGVTILKKKPLGELRIPQLAPFGFCFDKVRVCAIVRCPY